VVIADEGPGIAADAAASLFERFRRVPNASGAGAGLGLAIAKSFMERQGGRLLFDANAARGARFVMEFHDPM
jgi:signal transduction histidine kinase